MRIYISTMPIVKMHYKYKVPPFIMRYHNSRKPPRRHATASMYWLAVKFVIGLMFGYCLANTARKVCYNAMFKAAMKMSPFNSLPVVTSGHKAVPVSQYESEEKYDHRDLLMVGVMTTEKYLDTRARAIYDTWAKYIPGQVLFFVGRDTYYSGDLPIIRLQDIAAEDYPPQKKVFSMLNYMHQHYSNRFHFFMRADDDVYVKGERLGQLLRSIDSSKLLYMGQSGEGVPDEVGKLGFGEGVRPYCMGGPGVVLSRVVLEMLVPYIGRCVKETASLHEDTELGRCLYNHVGVSCSSAYEWAELFVQNYRDKQGSFTHKLGDSELKAITLHPIKSTPFMYRLHNFFQSNQVVHLRKRISALERGILLMNSLIAGENSELMTNERESDNVLVKNHNDYLIQDSVSSANNSESITWKSFSHAHIHTDESAKTKISLIGRMNMNAIRSSSRAAINRLNRRNPHLSFRVEKRLSGYHAILPSHGHYIKLIHKLSYYSLRHQNYKRFLYPITLTARFSHINSFEAKDQRRSYSIKPDDNDKIVNIILPLAGKFKALTIFLRNYITVVASYPMTTSLTIALYKDPNDEYYKNRQLIQMTQEKNPQANIRLQDHNHVSFSRASAMHFGIDTIHSDSSLLLLMDVDMLFTSEFLRRVQLNTIAGKQVYFPIYFTQYDPTVVCSPTCEIDPLDLRPDKGAWRPYGYGMVGIYKQDYLAIGGFNTSIVGWGEEDITLYEQVIYHNLTVFRSADPDLIHLYHPKACSKDLPANKLLMCENSRADLWGSQEKLIKMLERFGVVDTLNGF